MKLCYQVATPDVSESAAVTAYQGPLDNSLKTLSSLGYEGVEFMTLNPDKLNVRKIKKLLKKYNLSCTMVCTGEIFGQLGISYTSPDAKKRKEAIERTKRIIDFAASLDAKVNIGRIRGDYCDAISRDKTDIYAVLAFHELADYAASRKVVLALEPITIMQTGFINTVEEAAEMVHRIGNESFRLMMDVFHMNLEEKDLYESIRKYCSLNVHVHLADNNRRYPGQCGLDFKKIIQTFRDSGYEGDYTTEIYQLPDMKTSAEESATHLIPIIREVYG